MTPSWYLLKCKINFNFNVLLSKQTQNKHFTNQSAFKPQLSNQYALNFT